MNNGGTFRPAATSATTSGGASPSPNAAQVTGLTLSVLRDDGIVVYVNGAEAFRDNMPAGTITTTTMALNAQFDAAETTYFTFTIPAALLREGTNVLAVSVHNESRQGTGDLSFDARLTTA